METNGLRVGNFVMVDGHTCRVTAIPNRMGAFPNVSIEADYTECHNDNLIQGIPITEEWLNREPNEVKEWKGNGYDYQPETSKTLERIYYLGPDMLIVFTSFSYRDSEQDEWITDENIYVRHDNHVIDLYKNEVHVLQNLYFALAGEEMKIN